jgi:hypothetical protein
MSDAPAANAMPAASQRRHVGHGAVSFAVGLPGNRTAAEVKIWAPRIAARPAASLRAERADLFGGAQAWAGEGRAKAAADRSLDPTCMAMMRGSTM